MKVAKVIAIIFACFANKASNAVEEEVFICKAANDIARGGSENISLALEPAPKVRPKGDKGDPGLNGRQGPPGSVDYEQIRMYIDSKTNQKVFSSCAAIKLNDNRAENGLYDIKDGQGSIYRTYCDMTTGGGGWTLVASVHEDHIQGKCTVGDKWSSEHGNSASHPHGDGAWENTATFGAPESAASDDYKNPGYFNMVAKDIMIWHVPNKSQLKEYKHRASMMYHTKTGILENYGGSLFKLFRDHFPLRSGVYLRTSGNGPSSPIVWDRGSNALMVHNTAPNMRKETTAGYIQFRAINHEKGAYAICPGVKINPGYGNVEHCCIGGTSNQGSLGYCGDFSGYDWSGYATATAWSTNRAMTESVVMIFYR